MKRIIFLSVTSVIIISLVCCFSVIGCKEEAAPAEEAAVEEEVAPAEEAAVEEEVAPSEEGPILTYLALSVGEDPLTLLMREVAEDYNKDNPYNATIETIMGGLEC